ncbi:MAG TPA: hypothetical protein VNY84_05275 [Acidimicrobiales bacterium]|nr:hypothetical protein [Acidimicrobiales bacterium]
MGKATIISDEVRTVEASTVGGRVLVAPGLLNDALGWQLKAEGLCRDDTCVPVRDTAALFVDGELDVAAVAAALGRSAVVDAEARLAAIAWDAESRRQALHARRAPPFALADLDGRFHRLEEWAGRKKLLLAFSSW